MSRNRLKIVRKGSNETHVAVRRVFDGELREARVTREFWEERLKLKKAKKKVPEIPPEWFKPLTGTHPVS
jgi:hypothetical protein